MPLRPDPAPAVRPPHDDVRAIPAEARLLLACARRTLDDAAADAVRRALAAPLDWAQVLALGERHCLLPLLFRHVDALGITSIPRDHYTRLWSVAETAQRRNVAMTIELLRVLDLLEANGIPAAPYKGPALAEALFGDVALREFGDLDVLVRHEDVVAAADLLSRHGYAPEYPLSPATRRALLTSPVQYHYAMVHAKSRLMVELHWKTDALFPVESHLPLPWWTCTARDELLGRPVRALPGAAVLAALTLHGTKHHWHRLAWLADVAELVRSRNDVDWLWVVATAHAMRCERRLLVGLWLARALFGVELPDAIERRIDAMPEVAPTAASMIAPMFAAMPASTAATDRPPALSLQTLRVLRIDLDLYEHAAHKLRHLLNVTLAPSLVEWTRWPLPRALHCLYLPLRLGRLMKKYALSFAARA